MIKTDGPHAQKALKILSENIRNTDSILEKAKLILQDSVDPYINPSPLPADGLLYGLIQSGKTSIITLAAAMAADNGFKFIIILTSDNNPLYGQTYKRTRQALRGLNVLGKKDWEEAEKFQRQVANAPFVVICSKNSKTLEGMLNALQSANGKGANKLPAFIIDDEADQASLDTNTSKKEVEEISAINKLITKLRDFFQVKTYLQVTATPQALFLQTPDHPYRPSFTVLSEPGEGYVGGEAFFGPDSKLLRPVDINEVELLRSSHQPTPKDAVPPGLRTALLTFLVAATAKEIKGDGQEYAFLCHVSHKGIDHSRIVNLIDKFKEEIKSTLDNPGQTKYASLMKELDKAYADLKETEPDMPALETIVAELGFHIPGTNIKLINAASSDEITLDHLYNVFIGGNKLGRGVTIERLLVSYYGRNPKSPNADTVLQHARMYGYREKDKGVTRLFLPNQLADHFRIIHQMEKALRKLVEQHPKGKFEGIYVSSPMKATRRNVLDPNSIGVYTAGGYCHPRYPLRDKQSEVSTAFIDEKLAQYDHDSGRDYDEVTVDFVSQLVKKCEADPAVGSEMWNQKSLQATLEKIKTIFGNKAYIRVRRGLNQGPYDREDHGILTKAGEQRLVPSDALTLFIFKMDARGSEPSVWWPMLRFPDGNYAIAFSFDH